MVTAGGIIIFLYTYSEHSVLEINHAVYSTVGGVAVDICDSLHKPKHSKLPPARIDTLHCWAEHLVRCSGGVVYIVL